MECASYIMTGLQQICTLFLTGRIGAGDYIEFSPTNLAKKESEVDKYLTYVNY